MTNTKNKNYLSLAIWIIMLLTIGSVLGFLSKPDISHWYLHLNRSSLTPPNYIFPIAWTILYTFIGSCGWIIWNEPSFSKLNTIKRLYIFQLILNWSWTPLFFNYHLTGISLIILILMDIFVATIIGLS
ncbi:MAG: tryptophan-rich sensory protein, partial [Bacteroidetes bacterium]|nr:tryptophan-rich sensory protein [Bacteroidota bacterium]